MRKAKSYDELVSLARKALSDGARGEKVLKRLHFSGSTPVLCAFLTAVAYADESARRKHSPELTPWTFLLPMDERTLATLPRAAREMSVRIAILSGTIFDPVTELVRASPSEQINGEFLEGAESFRKLPDWLTTYADCLEDMYGERKSKWGRPRLKFTTLSKALLTRYIREKSRSDPPAKAEFPYEDAAALIEIVSTSFCSQPLKLSWDSLRKVDERAQAYAGQNKLYYDSFYQSMIARYAQ